MRFSLTFPLAAAVGDSQQRLRRSHGRGEEEPRERGYGPLHACTGVPHLIACLSSPLSGLAVPPLLTHLLLQALYEDRRVGGELALKSGFLFTPNEAGLRRSNASLTTTAGAQPAGMPVEDPYAGCYPWNHPFPHWSNYVSHVPPYAEAARGHEISLLETNAARLDCHPSALHPGRPYAA